MEYTVKANVNDTVLIIGDPPILIKPVVANKPPVVIVTAPSTITLPAILTLSATASDPDGSIASYLWTKVSGGAAIITNQDKAIATVNGLVAGNYVFKIEVTDNQGAKISANTTSISVKAIVTPPAQLTANAGIDAVVTSNYLILDGVASKGTNPITVYQWSNVSGPAGYNIDNPNSARSGFSNLVQGIYVFRLTVTDSTGAKATDDISVTVKTGVVIPPVNPPTGSGYLSLIKSPSTTYNGQSNILIEGRRFDNIQNAINQNGNILRFFGGSGITIRNCYFSEASGGQNGGDRAIYFSGCSNVLIEKCLFSGQGGSILASLHGNGLIIRDNEFMNVRGPYPAATFIQLNTCNGSGYLIEKNRCENWHGESFSEDLISMFSTSGTVASPITIQDNLFRGGGPSRSGGGSTAGDHGGSNILYQRNKYFNPGQYGLSIVGGNNNKIIDNWIWQDQKPWNNVGLPIWGYSPPCSNAVVTGNRVHYVNKDGVLSNHWFDGQCSGAVQIPTDFALSEMNFPAKIITYITEDEIWQLRHETKRREADIIATATSATGNQLWPAQIISRPTATATGSVSGGIATLTSNSTPSAGNTISSQKWVKVSGTGGTITAETAKTTTVTGLTAGTHVFRLEVTQINNAANNVITQDAAWVTINI